VLSRVFTPIIFLNLILLITFSISINSLVEMQNINIIFYILFHLTFIYLLFYHYNYFLYILGFVYGVFFDLSLINSIGSHLLTFIILISIFVLIKKRLFLLSSYQVSITIFLTLIIVLFVESFFAFLFNNIYFTSSKMIKYIVISTIIFIPSIFILNKLNR